MSVSKRTRAVVLVCATTVLAGGCLTPNGTPFDTYANPAPDRVVVSVDGCDGSAHVAEFTETPQTVEIRVESDPPGPDACADSITVELEQPLAGRRVIDLSRGVEVQPAAE